MIIVVCFLLLVLMNVRVNGSCLIADAPAFESPSFCPDMPCCVFELQSALASAFNSFVNLSHGTHANNSIGPRSEGSCFGNARRILCATFCSNEGSFAATTREPVASGPVSLYLSTQFVFGFWQSCRRRCAFENREPGAQSWLDLRSSATVFIESFVSIVVNDPVIVSAGWPFNITDFVIAEQPLGPASLVLLEDATPAAPCGGDGFCQDSPSNTALPTCTLQNVLGAVAGGSTDDGSQGPDGSPNYCLILNEPQCLAAFKLGCRWMPGDAVRLSGCALVGPVDSMADIPCGQRPGTRLDCEGWRANEGSARPKVVCQWLGQSCIDLPPCPKLCSVADVQCGPDCVDYRCSQRNADSCLSSTSTTAQGCQLVESGCAPADLVQSPPPPATTVAVGGSAASTSSLIFFNSVLSSTTSRAAADDQLGSASSPAVPIFFAFIFVVLGLGILLASFWCLQKRDSVPSNTAVYPSSASTQSSLSTHRLSSSSSSASASSSSITGSSISSYSPSSSSPSFSSSSSSSSSLSRRGSRLKRTRQRKNNENLQSRNQPESIAPLTVRCNACLAPCKTFQKECGSCGASLCVSCGYCNKQNRGACDLYCRKCHKLIGLALPKFTWAEAQLVVKHAVMAAAKGQNDGSLDSVIEIPSLLSSDHSCAICLEPMGETKATVADCAVLFCPGLHVFHHSCVNQWFGGGEKAKHRNVCPLCKTKFSMKTMPTEQ